MALTSEWPPTPASVTGRSLAGWARPCKRPGAIGVAACDDHLGRQVQSRSSRTCHRDPITKRHKNITSHVFVPTGEAGLDVDSYIKVEDIRSVSIERLIKYRGDLTYPRIDQVQYILRVLLGL